MLNQRSSVAAEVPRDPDPDAYLDAEERRRLDHYDRVLGEALATAGAATVMDRIGVTGALAPDERRR